jgi:hypothetical protein
MGLYWHIRDKLVSIFVNEMEACMRMKLFAILLIVSTLCIAVESSFAITTVPVDVVCPICKTKNTFMTYASSGSYVYWWPSRFQYVFWPATYSTSLYQCKHCHLTLWMWDFEKLTPEQIERLRKSVSALTVEPTNKDYHRLPMTDRLAIAEKLYRVLRNKPESEDLNFWSDFYRTQAYHFARENHPDMARQARLNALAAVQGLIKDEKSAPQLKQNLVISAAMKHFVGDDVGAMADLESAEGLKFSDPDIPKENSEGFDEYLSKLISDYKTGIKAKNIPADLGKDEQE